MMIMSGTCGGNENIFCGVGICGLTNRLVLVCAGVPYVSLDVECIATAKEHNGRATAQIALVSHSEQPILNLCEFLLANQQLFVPWQSFPLMSPFFGSDVKPAGNIESYLEPLTGLNKQLLDTHGMSFERVSTSPPQHANMQQSRVHASLLTNSGNSHSSLAATFDQHTIFTRQGHRSRVTCVRAHRR